MDNGVCQRCHKRLRFEPPSGLIHLVQEIGTRAVTATICGSCSTELGLSGLLGALKKPLTKTG